MSPIVRLDSAGYRYPDGTRALENLNLEVSRGESLAIVGPNGGGKSTLILMLSGLIAPSSGKMSLFGREMNGKIVERAEEMFPIRKKIGVMFQDPDVQLFSATVFDDVAFGPINFGLSDEEVRKKVMKVLRYLKIEHLAEKHPYELSGGEKRKAALATAIVSDADLLILDEPTADLDPRSRDEFIRTINRLRKRGKTVITATHDMEIVPEIAERTVVLKRKVLKDGKTAEVLTDEKVMENAGLEPPYSVRIREILRKYGLGDGDFSLERCGALERLEEILKDCGKYGKTFY